MAISNLTSLNGYGPKTVSPTRKPTEVLLHGKPNTNTNADTNADTDTNTTISGASLAPSGSESSVPSMASTNSTNSISMNNMLHLSLERRQIFSSYWQTHPQPMPMAMPRSPLIQHYPSRSIDSDSNSNSESNETLQLSPTSTIPQQDLSHSGIEDNHYAKTLPLLTVSPSRRSIFGGASNNINNSNNNSNNNSTTDNHSALPDLHLQRFFSRHEHMKVLSSSLDDDLTTSTPLPPSSVVATALLRKRRPRSYSCSDSMEASAAARPRPTRSANSLVSCLKRRNSHCTSDRDRDGNKLTSSTTSSVHPLESRVNSSCNSQAHECTGTGTGTGTSSTSISHSTRRPSVTFDSQIEIVAFESTSLYEQTESNTDGAWTDLFEW